MGLHHCRLSGRKPLGLGLFFQFFVATRHLPARRLEIDVCRARLPKHFALLLVFILQIVLVYSVAHRKHDIVKFNLGARRASFIDQDFRIITLDIGMLPQVFAALAFEGGIKDLFCNLGMNF
jgi:hypothetical protein